MRQKNEKFVKPDFDQQIRCKAPVRWPKYTTDGRSSWGLGLSAETRAPKCYPFYSKVIIPFIHYSLNEVYLKKVGSPH